MTDTRPISCIESDVISGKTILLTGATGSFGKQFCKTILPYNPKAVRCFSRGELLQYQMRQELKDDRLKFFIGDVRDKERLKLAISGCDIIVHAAALKRIDAVEYNVLEGINTNVLGSANVALAAIECGVEKVIVISTDKACAPINAYGKTKALMESIIVQSNTYARQRTKLACVRYGNVVNSRGSVVPIFKEQAKSGVLTITHPDMTRFWLTLEQGVHFVLAALSMMRGGEIFVPKIPSVVIEFLANIIAPNAEKVVTGIRPGEKLHETLITEDEARHTKEFEDHFVIVPEFAFWTEDTYYSSCGDKLPEGFSYSSKNNNQWLTSTEIRKAIE